jgi:serine/threonine-protein kinase
MEVLPQMAVEVPQSLQSMIGTRLESVSLLDSASGELVSHEFETDEIITGGPESAMFKARASVSGAPVIAVKLFDPELIPREQLEKVTKRIIAIQAAMEDVNILKILGSATVGGNPAIVYEYIPNTLETLVQREPEGVSLELLINVLAQMLNAIGYSHMHRGTDGEIRRLPHMNLKLSRFFFHEETGKVKLEGSAVWRSVVEIWGHKKHLWEEPGVDLSALSPEAFVLDSRSVNPFSADIYALGVAIYRLATGEAPFGGSNVEEYSFAHLRKFPIPPKVHRYTIPSWLDAMILRCLEKEPEKRWRSATQMELQIGKDFSQLGAAGKR